MGGWREACPIEALRHTLRVIAHGKKKMDVDSVHTAWINKSNILPPHPPHQDESSVHFPIEDGSFRSG